MSSSGKNVTDSFFSLISSSLLLFPRRCLDAREISSWFLRKTLLKHLIPIPPSGNSSWWTRVSGKKTVVEMLSTHSAATPHPSQWQTGLLFFYSKKWKEITLLQFRPRARQIFLHHRHEKLEIAFANDALRQLQGGLVWSRLEREN